MGRVEVIGNATLYHGDCIEDAQRHGMLFE